MRMFKMADTTMKMPTPPPRTTPTLHPAAQEAAAAYSDALSHAAKMEVELREIRVSYDGQARELAFIKRQLADSEFSRRALERYAVEITTHLSGISRAIDAAIHKSQALAKQQPKDMPAPEVVVEELERAIADAAINVRKDHDTVPPPSQ